MLYLPALKLPLTMCDFPLHTVCMARRHQRLHIRTSGAKVAELTVPNHEFLMHLLYAQLVRWNDLRKWRSFSDKLSIRYSRVHQLIHNITHCLNIKKHAMTFVRCCLNFQRQIYVGLIPHCKCGCRFALIFFVSQFQNEHFLLKLQI